MVLPVQHTIVGQSYGLLKEWPNSAIEVPCAFSKDISTQMATVGFESIQVRGTLGTLKNLEVAIYCFWFSVLI